MGYSICLEGGEGSGKGTVAKKLKSRFESAGYSVHTTREPGGLTVCEKIRGVILDDASEGDMSALCETYLYAASRAQLVEKDILPAMGLYDFVIIDRFVYSSYVYQGIVEGVGLDKVISINSFALGAFAPDLVVYLDIEPVSALARISKDSTREVNRFDRKDIAFHEKIRQGYLSLAGVVDNFHIVDASKTPDEVVKSIESLIVTD